MKYEEFDKIVGGLTRLSRVKIRDPKSPIPRGYTLRAWDEGYLLISVDGALNIRFYDYKESLISGVVDLLFEGVNVGAISIKEMEVEE